MQALQKKQKTWALLLLGALLGLAAFLCLYGTAPLDPANDAWIWYGYDETDIHQHYAGWLGFRNSSWQFPLAQADALAYPAGTGVNISFTDSLPWVSVLFKLLAPVLPAQFQWFGLYELAAFILQGMAAALVLGLFLEGTTLGVLTVIAACPSGAMVSILSIRYGVDDTFASRVNFLSTILCAVTLPVVTSFLL